MSDGVVVERRQSKVRSAVNQTTIFRPQGNVLEERKVGADAVCKHTRRLVLRARNAAEAIARRIEDKRTSLCQQVWADPEPCRRRQAEDKAAGCLVNVGFNSRESGGCEILLCVSVIAIDGLSSEPAVEPIPVTDENAPGVVLRSWYLGRSFPW